MAAALVGSVILQIPIGALSDRLPRRGVMIGCALGTTAGAIFGTGTSTGNDAFVAMFIIGASSFPLYSLAIAYTNDWISAEQRVGASGFLVMVNGVGAIVGPLAASALISSLGNAGFFWSLALIHVLVATYLLIRVLIRDAVPVEDQSTYQPYPARSSALATSIGRRIPKKPIIPKPGGAKRKQRPEGTDGSAS